MNDEERHLLIIDDDDSYREVLSRSLSRRGFVVATAAGVQEGLEICGRHDPEYILLDLNLAGQSGLNLIQPLLDIVPATVDLSGAEIELIEFADRLHRLEQALTGAEAGQWDICLIDCPPSLGMLTLNALIAAESLIVPLQCEFFALEGLSLLLRTVERVRSSFNPRLQMHGVVLTMFDRRNNLSEQVASDVRSFMGDRVYETMIPRNVRVSEAPSHGKPVMLYDFKSVGAQAYAHLAGEMLRRERRLVAA